MDEADYYDEFGNYIGPEEDQNGGEFDAYDSILNEPIEEAEEAEEHNLIKVSLSTSTTSAAVVLREDKKFFPSATEVYGESVQVLVEEEDSQPLTEPIIAPVKEIIVDTVSGDNLPPKLNYSLDYHLELLNVPERCRNVSVIGHLHHGKTSLLDLLVSHCHAEEPQAPRTTMKTAYSRERLPRYLDSLKLEQERGISLRAKPISLLLTNSRASTSYAVNLLDCPGHADFREDVGLGLSLMSESVLLVVDAVEGVQAETEAGLRAALNLNKSIILVLTKIERLWMELKLPPMDAYYKLKHTVDKLNTLAGRCLFAPESGNVLFASALGGYAFSLHSFVAKTYPAVKDSLGLSRRLWGDCYYSEVSKSFSSRPQQETTGGAKRTFVTFILEPLYKLYTQTLSAADSSALQAFIDENLSGGTGTSLNAKELFKTNPRPLLKQVLCKFFGNEPILGLTDALTSLPVASTDDGRRTDGVLMSICKVYPPVSIKSVGNRKIQEQFSIDQPRVLCRLWSGRIRSGQVIKIYSAHSEEVSQVQLGRVCVPCTRYDLPIDEVEGTSAPWVLLTGIPLDRIIKYGLIGSSAAALSPPRTFIPNPASFFRVSLEPLVPSELPKMLQVLRLLGLLYPSLQMQVEESGEHVLKAPGELYMDCVLHDLRTLGQVQIRLSDPSASLAESVSEISTLKCFADTANGKLRITMIAEPMEKGLSELIETSYSVLPEEAVLRERFGWDRLSCRSVLAVSSTGGNVLIDDTFGDIDEALMTACRSSLIQGFQWAVREGPLCEESIRNVKFRLVDLKIVCSEDEDVNASMLSAAQIVPAVRRCCYAAFLTASPRLLEPVLQVNITAPSECLEVIYNILARRRGHILADTPLAGTPLYSILALLPVLDSPGFEVDLRSMTAGAAMPSSTFTTWQAIPGDPLDQSIRPALLEPAPAPALARDCLLKMRKRRGIGEDVRLDKYFDDPSILAELKRII